MDMKLGDLEPGLKLRCTTPDGTGVDLTEAETVTIHVIRPNGTEFTRTATRDADQTAHPGVHTMPWIVGDLPIAGDYWIESVVDWGSDRPQTFPARGFLHLYVSGS